MKNTTRSALSTSRFLAVAVALFASFVQPVPAQDNPQLGAWTGDAAKSAKYKDATALDPLYEDKKMWPQLTGKEYYTKAIWPATKVMTWAKPGENGGKRVKGLDPADPANWLENGKPAKTVEFDENTDIVLPSSDVPYVINFRDDNEETWQELYRHVTVGENCDFNGGGDGRGRMITGNVWIKRGGSMYAQGATKFAGTQHTFFRNDSSDLESTKDVNYQMFSQYFEFLKEEGKSVEFLGHVTCLDEFRGESGNIIIVGPDSWLQPGRNAAPILKGGATLALMDGARFGNWQNNFGNIDLEVTGNVWGGLPDRPLTRSARFDAHFKNYTQNTDIPDLNENSRISNLPRVPSLVFHKGSTLKSHSTDPAKARLVIGWDGGFASSFGPDPANLEAAKERTRQDENYPAHMKWFTALPRGIDMWLADDVVIEDVTLDDFRKGGIMLENLSLPDQWKGVVYGPGNAATGKELFSKSDSLDRGGRY